MPYGTFSANQMQFGRETTAGTGVPATDIWRGVAIDIEDASEIVSVEEQVGLLVPTDRSYIGKLAAKLAIPETELTFEQFPHVLEAGVKTVTPTGPTPYVYTYVPSLTTTPNTLKPYTWETGNTVAGDGNEMAYSLVESFTLSGKQGEAWKVSSNWFGRQKVVAAMTGALVLDPVEVALFSKTKLYIDAVGGTIGTTQKTGTLLEASIEVTTGAVPVFSGDGNLYFASHKIVLPKFEFTITMELESGGQVAAQRAAKAAGTIQLFRLECPGSSADRKLVVDFAGRYTTVGSYSNSDGNTTVQLSGEATYSSTAALFYSFVVTNLLATL